ncbi:dTDP-4-dehydrorhamnose reductase [Puia dinghuensis]|uniref:dTDP-4-dehydrorhamnose reductase n=1 Tax=Puia dinghuensis TaxID=1792502 RepID=A0A8J2XTK8_9BACT|nr:dTDP-4-dehydrorhamnose reductase [Puia dinghuensis]GGB04231.1 NAD(P)-dependent oxidoreductase [Puia dinghuensis]
MATPTILVTGANGQLGRELQVLAAAYPQYSFVFADRSQLSIEDPQQIATFFNTHKPAWCINCAAYTAVDKAETEKDAAFRINGEGPGYLAAACRNSGARLIHVSTDYVFDGNSATPLKENDPTAPINAYGASKLAGEQRAMENHPGGTVIIRTAWVYSEFGNNFVKTMIRLMKERPAINVVDDQIGSPTYAADLAAAILHIVNSPNFVPGIYHYSNEGRISWYQFASAIRNHTGSTCTVNPIPSSQFPTPAKRPHYSLLDKTLIRKTYNIIIPDWEPSLLTCLGRL